MALLAISGDPSSRFEDAAQNVARLLSYELIGEARLDDLLAEEFGGAPIPHQAWRAAAVSILARLATEHHLVIAVAACESLFDPMPMLLRAGIVATEDRRTGTVMLDQRLERSAAQAELRRLDADAKRLRKARWGRTTPRADDFDIIFNASHLDSAQIAEILRAACGSRRLSEQGLLSTAAEAEIQFRTRLDLVRHSIAPAARTSLKPVAFGHSSEEMFANLLDFYRIRWEYEPRSFPLQWDKDGHAIEAFTPDFYLPEFDQYIELTTMKQALVTRKNRKVKLLRAIYPHVNIQVFYQKDFQELVFKYGLREAHKDAAP